MTVTLHRFPISHFSEKGRALLDMKRLDYTIVEHQIGLPQRALVRLSGQRKVPVIEHDGRVVHDSTAIALYLEEAFPDHRRLLPPDEARRREVLDLEERLDRAFATSPFEVWIDSVRTEPEKLARLLDLEVHGVGPRMGSALGAFTRWVTAWGPGRRRLERSQGVLRAMLLELTERLSRSRYLVGDEPSLADVAAVGLTLPLEFPRSKHLALAEWAGVGARGWADHPDYARFFEWRRAFYADFLA